MASPLAFGAYAMLWHSYQPFFSIALGEMAAMAFLERPEQSRAACDTRYGLVKHQGAKGQR
jgi:hypothetical protein